MSLADAIKKAVLSVVGNRLDYSALYPATVVVHAPDATVQVIPDDARIAGAGMGSLPIRYGLAGALTVVAPGDRCLVGFEAQDPRRPYVSLWAEGSLAVTQTISATASLALAAPTVVVGPATPGAGSLTAGASEASAGSGSGGAVALANLVKAELEAFRNQFNIHTHASFAAPPVPLIPTVGNVNASNLKADA